MSEPALVVKAEEPLFLANRLYLVELRDGRRVSAHLAARLLMRFARITPGMEVLVEPVSGERFRIVSERR